MIKPFKQQLCIFFINCLPSGMMSKDFQILVHSIKIFISSTNTEYHANRIDYKYLYMSISNTLNFLSLKDYMPSQKFIMNVFNFYPLAQVQYTIFPLARQLFSALIDQIKLRCIYIYQH